MSQDDLDADAQNDPAQVNNEFEASESAELEATEEKKDEDKDELVAGLGGWGLSLAIHALALLTLLLIVFGVQQEKVPPPRPVTLVDSQQEDEFEEEQEQETDVEVTVEVEVMEQVTEQPVEMVTDDVELSETTEVDVTVTVTDALDSPTLGVAGGQLFMESGGGAGEGAGFFGVGKKSGQAKRVCLIIDMSKSLREEQIAVIKDRLVETLDYLGSGQYFEVVFFSGPCWFVGDDANEIRKGWGRGKNHHDYSPPPDGLPQGQWRPARHYILDKARKYVFDTLHTTVGTDWRHPFQIAYNMDPKPDVIYFLTDGRVDNSELTLNIIRSEGRGIPVNTIAFGLKDQDGVSSLREMSELTNGEHTALDMQTIKEMYSKLGAVGQ